MKRSWIVIACAVLMVSACGNKGGDESAAVKTAAPADETSMTKAADRAAPPAMEEKAPAVETPAAAATDKPVTAAAPAAAPAPAPTPKPAETEEPRQAGVLSKEDALTLARKSGCLACHKIETKLVGPAWMDVSKRYKGDAGAKARLVAKVKAGGKGNWTEVTGGIPMPAYSPRVSDENIEKLVTFVLSL